MPMRPPKHRPQGWRSDDDRRRAYEALRPKVNARGYTYQWRKLRESLPRTPCNRPSCRAPWHPGFHLDHITARAKGGTDHPSNLEWLCPSCHSAKTCASDGGLGNPIR